MAKIKLVVTDLDGSLTDGTVEYIAEGSKCYTSRRFSVIDGMGFELLRNNDIATAILTGSEGIDIKKRAMWLRVTALFENCRQKEFRVDLLIEDRGISLDEVAYFGDDINDLEAMKTCGLVGCPKSAQADVLNYVEFDAPNGHISNGVAGIDAFRKFADFVINYNKNWEWIKNLNSPRSH